MSKTKILTFVAVMAALANIMSIPPLAIPLSLGTFTSSIHFFQLAIFICAILAGPYAGLLSGFVGGLYMTFTRIPFIVGGIAILGGSAGLYSRKVRPVFAGLLAWLTTAPYVLVTDYVWFTLFIGHSSTIAWVIIIPIMINLSIQSVICAILADIIVRYFRRGGITLQ